MSVMNRRTNGVTTDIKPVMEGLGSVTYMIVKRGELQRVYVYR